MDLQRRDGALDTLHYDYFTGGPAFNDADVAHAFSSPERDSARQSSSRLSHAAPGAPDATISDEAQVTRARDMGASCLPNPGGAPAGEADLAGIERIIPCFTPGTGIATPQGNVPVEDLREGDKVLTRDNGVQEVRWCGTKRVAPEALAERPHLQPVKIRAGALGGGVPERDITVSPNHRMLVADDRTKLYFEEHEVLVAAGLLVDNDGIETARSEAVTYIHFMFDRHEVVLANGAWSESFQPGTHSMQGLGDAQKDEIFELFPELATLRGLGDYTTARRALNAHEAVVLQSGL